MTKATQREGKEYWEHTKRTHTAQRCADRNLGAICQRYEN